MIKSQSAMEYLMTYGWSILIVAVVLGALAYLGVFNPLYFAPKANPGSCQVFRPNGAGTSYDINLLGVCNGEIPYYVAQFDGQAYIVDVEPQYIPTNIPITITVWIDPSVGSGGVTSFGSTPCGGDSYGIFLISQSLRAGAGCPGVNSQLDAENERWSFVALTINGLGEGFYLNNQYSFNSVASNPLPSGYTNYLGIGTFNYGLNGGDGSTFNGLISNIQIYNASLDQNSITALYQEGIGGAPIDLQNLVGWWPLNGNANDYSGNGNNGVPTNVVYTSSWISSYNPP